MDEFVEYLVYTRRVLSRQHSGKKSSDEKSFKTKIIGEQLDCVQCEKFEIRYVYRSTTSDFYYLRSILGIGYGYLKMKFRVVGASSLPKIRSYICISPNDCYKTL